MESHMINQPIMNIGMLGSVSDGKSTTVYSMTGTKTQRHSNEMKRNITIKPGYANMKIYKNNDMYNIKEGELVHHVSFIDCPGHYQLIVTMMSCIRLMDGIILVVSAAEPIEKKPQLIQHIMAIKMSGIKNVIVLLNKLDLVKKTVAKERYKQLVEVLNKYEVEPNIIIPVCMNHNIGVDILLKNIMKFMSPKQKMIEDKPIFMISRSFDINKVNTIIFDKCIKDISGGVIGGSLVYGEFKVGDEIEILPGIITKNKDGKLLHKPHYTKVLSLKSETTELDLIVPGGLIGIGTNIDPYYCKNDSMIGMMCGLKGHLPPVYYEIKMSYNIIQFDSNQWTFSGKAGNNIIVIVGTNCIDSNIINYNDNFIHLRLSKPVCIDNKDGLSSIILCDKNYIKEGDNAESFQIIAYGKLVDDISFEKPTTEYITEIINEGTLEDDIDIDDI